jgi:carbonic anhydrase
VFRYDLELHAVHESSSGKISVVGIVYKYGHPDPFLSKVFKWLSLYG